MQVDWSPLLSTKEAARYLSMSHRTLERWRIQGTGPKYQRFPQGTVRYRREDLERWANASLGDCSLPTHMGRDSKR